MIYKSLIKNESFGKHGIGIEILVASTQELNLPTETDLIDIGYETADLIKEAITASINAKDPEAKARAVRERKELLELFGLHKIYVEEIPNGYCSRACCKHLPWFVVTTEIGRIKIGWRKNVINIDWSELSEHYRPDADLFFSDENVTKGDYSIHAWGLEKARQYINKLLN